MHILGIFYFVGQVELIYSFMMVRSFFQSICVLGYCVFPLVIATLLCFLTRMVSGHVILRLVIVSVGFVWSTRGNFIICFFRRLLIINISFNLLIASVVFMSQLVPPKKKALTVYPVLLFYIFISWMILIQ